MTMIMSKTQCNNAMTKCNRPITNIWGSQLHSGAC